MSTQDDRIQNYSICPEGSMDVRNSQRDLLFSLDLGVTDLAVIEDISKVMIQEKVDVVKADRIQTAATLIPSPASVH